MTEGNTMDQASAVGPLTKERLLATRAELLEFRAKVENTWQQTNGKIALLDQLLEEMAKQQHAGGGTNG